MSKKHKYYNIFSEIISDSNIEKAYKAVMTGENKYSKEAIEFHRNETVNLKALKESLINETYQFGEYNKFYVYEPKTRLIHAPQFKDKIVQIAINNVLKQIYQPCFIYDSYGSIDNKGTHKCVNRITHFLRKAKWEWGDKAYIVKLDVKKFFYSIDREILKKIYKNKIGCQKTLSILFKIIDSANQIDNKGLPLGNTISQLSANVYMNEVDQYAKRKISLKYYLRYMDDMIIITKNKSQAKEIKSKISEFIENKLNMAMNKEKSKIFPISQGVNAIGFKIYPTHRLLRNQTKKNIKRKLKAMENLLKEDKMTVSKAEQILNSWYGHAKHGNSYNFINKLIDKYKFIKLTDKGLKINKEHFEKIKGEVKHDKASR